MTDIITKQEAVKLGLDRYFTGKPCKHGHIAERRVRNSGCVKCASKYERNWQQNNKSKVVNINKKSYKKWISKDENRQNTNDYMKQYRSTPVGQLATRRNNNKLTFEQRKDARLKNRYGISLNEYNEMVNSQDSKCAICCETIDVLYVDHDHDTGAVRELLCSSCNKGLGHFKDNPTFLRQAAQYIESHKE
jgi:hypothetical protein